MLSYNRVPVLVTLPGPTTKTRSRPLHGCNLPATATRREAHCSEKQRPGEIKRAARRRLPPGIPASIAPRTCSHVLVPPPTRSKPWQQQLPIFYVPSLIATTSRTSLPDRTPQTVYGNYPGHKFSHKLLPSPEPNQSINQYSTLFLRCR